MSSYIDLTWKVSESNISRLWNHLRPLSIRRRDPTWRQKGGDELGRKVSSAGQLCKNKVKSPGLTSSCNDNLRGGKQVGDQVVQMDILYLRDRPAKTRMKRSRYKHVFVIGDPRLATRLGSERAVQ